MKDEKIFDILERAEDDSMDRLIGKCPEISDNELDKILEMSERKYNMKKKGKNIDSQQENGGITVSGVERIKRPAWIRPLTIAASFVLVAGVAAGSTALLRRSRTDVPDSSNAAADVFNDKDALAALCKNAPSHYNKLEASYVRDQTSDYLTLNEKNSVEYDTNTNALLTYVDEKESDKYDGLDSASVVYIYNGRQLVITPEYNRFEVITDERYNAPTYTSYNYSYDLFFAPEELAEVTLADKSSWSITGKETICGRECAVIEKEDENGRLTAYIDAETGVELKYVYEGNSEGEKIAFEVTDIKYNEAAHVKTPFEVRKMVEDGGYEPYVSGNETDPAVACDLSYLGSAEQPAVTTAPDKPSSATTTTAKSGEGTTAPVSAETTSEAVTEPDTTEVTTVEPTTVENVTEPDTTEASAPVVSIEDLAGQWEVQYSDGTATVDEAPIYNGIITIYVSGIYEFTDADGNYTEGAVRTEFENIGGTDIPSVAFYSYGMLQFEGVYREGEPDMIYIGNGGLSRLVRK